MASICRSACRSFAVQTVLAGSLRCFLSATHDSVRHPSLPACRPAGRWAWLMRRPTAASSLKSSRCSTAHTSIKCLRTPSARWAGAELVEQPAVSQLSLRCTASSAVVQSQGRPALPPSPNVSWFGSTAACTTHLLVGPTTPKTAPSAWACPRRWLTPSRWAGGAALHAGCTTAVMPAAVS